MRNVIKAVSGWRIVLVVFALLSVVTLPSEADADPDLWEKDEPPSIGDIYAGGVVFYIDQSGRNGLVTADTVLPGTYSWWEAQKACLAYHGSGYSGWYLPSQWELNELYQHKNLVNVVWGGFQEDSGPTSYYWSSTEGNHFVAGSQCFGRGSQEWDDKYRRLRVRCVRAYNYQPPRKPIFPPW